MPYGWVKADGESNEEYLASIPVDDPWRKTILQLHEKLVHLDPDYQIDQIKEKFGELRFYYDSKLEEAIPEISAAINLAVRTAELAVQEINQRS